MEQSLKLKNAITHAYDMLEYEAIRQKLASFALTDEGKEVLLRLEPYLDFKECQRRMEETTAARRLLDQFGTPPLATMKVMEKVLEVCRLGTMLLPNELEDVAAFLNSCKRMKRYLERAEQSGISIAYYGREMNGLEDLVRIIQESIMGNQVLDQASTELKSIRRKMELANEKIKEKLESLLREKKSIFADRYISVRNGHFVLPVKKEYKNTLQGSVIDVSGSGNTLFVEPSVINKIQAELTLLEIQEENEVHRILYELTNYVASYEKELKLNSETMVVLDIIFAKGKLSENMNAIPVSVTMDKTLRIIEGRHPLLQTECLVPLNFELGKENRGIVITGPNTGGKTVALKTVGLLSIMAQSGLHIPAKEGTIFSMHNMVLCDIGDGQSIHDNLSTFSAHIKRIIEILHVITEETLVLLDELGSGTDPAEGMGIAIAILEELRRKECHFLVTTHYPEVKEYAKRMNGIENAKMAFDRETLSPLYQLIIGEAGESCAFYIAERLGLSKDMLEIAKKAAYGDFLVENQNSVRDEIRKKKELSESPRIVNSEKIEKKKNQKEQFQIGDSVYVSPTQEIGIVFAKMNDFGEVGVQIKGVKHLISHKRVKIHVPASELYPENYDFSILFDSVENRKARHKMERRYVPELEIKTNKGELIYRKEDSK